MITWIPIPKNPETKHLSFAYVDGVVVGLVMLSCAGWCGRTGNGDHWSAPLWPQQNTEAAARERVEARVGTEAKALATYLSLLNDRGGHGDQDIPEEHMDALDEAWAKLSPAGRVAARAALAAAKAAAVATAADQ